MRLSLPAFTRSRRRSRFVNVAHRGASGQVAENTLAAVRRAVELGSDMVEVDVQRTRDGVLVVLHDTTLERTTNVREVYPGRASVAVGDLTYAELARLDAGAWRGPGDAGERVPTLSEVVELVHRSKVGLLVELKAPGRYPGVVADLVATLQGVPGFVRDAVAHRRLVVQSFDVAAMKEHATLAPEIPVGLLGAPARANLPALATWATQVNPHHRAVDRAYVDRLHDLGLECLVWTVNRGPAIRRVLRMGVDGVITNHPDLLARVRAEELSSGQGRPRMPLLPVGW